MDKQTKLDQGTTNSFMGLMGYYQKFVRGYRRIVKPLIRLHKKNVVIWDKRATKAFEEKEAMTSILTLVMPN